MKNLRNTIPDYAVRLVCLIALLIFMGAMAMPASAQSEDGFSDITLVGGTELFQAICPNNEAPSDACKATGRAPGSPVTPPLLGRGKQLTDNWFEIIDPSGQHWFVYDGGHTLVTFITAEVPPTLQPQGQHTAVEGLSITLPKGSTVPTGKVANPDGVSKLYTLKGLAAIIGFLGLLAAFTYVSVWHSIEAMLENRVIVVRWFFIGLAAYVVTALLEKVLTFPGTEQCWGALCLPMGSPFGMAAAGLNFLTGIVSFVALIALTIEKKVLVQVTSGFGGMAPMAPVMPGAPMPVAPMPTTPPQPTRVTIDCALSARRNTIKEQKKKGYRLVDESLAATNDQVHLVFNLEQIDQHRDMSTPIAFGVLVCAIAWLGAGVGFGYFFGIRMLYVSHLDQPISTGTLPYLLLFAIYGLAWWEAIADNKKMFVRRFGTFIGLFLLWCCVPFLPIIGVTVFPFAVLQGWNKETMKDGLGDMFILMILTAFIMVSLGNIALINVYSPLHSTDGGFTRDPVHSLWARGTQAVDTVIAQLRASAPVQ